MSVTPIFGKHGNRALATCDSCNHKVTVTCDYLSPTHPNEGQIRRKLAAQGWANLKKSLRCPSCEVKRKAIKKEPSMAETTPITSDLRRPTREQKRVIIQMLEAAYDIAGQRYSGNDTDKTVADAIGGGTLPGWVTELREEFFGPSGANADMDGAIEDLRQAGTAFRYLLESLDVVKKSTKQIETHMAQQKERMNRAISRIEAIKAAVGPKAARI